LCAAAEGDPVEGVDPAAAAQRAVKGLRQLECFAVVAQAAVNQHVAQQGCRRRPIGDSHRSCLLSLGIRPPATGWSATTDPPAARYTGRAARAISRTR